MSKVMKRFRERGRPEKGGGQSKEVARAKEKVQGMEAGREDTRVKKVAHKRRRPRAGRRLRQDEALGKKGSQIKEEARVKEEAKGHCSYQN